MDFTTIMGRGNPYISFRTFRAEKERGQTKEERHAA